MPVPAVVGRFRVQRTLGSGGFATVHLAEDPQLESLVAVKILAENWAVNADVHRRFVDEARLLRRVDSDHLVRVYDIGELEDGRPYFVMSYADGGTLSDVLAERPAPWQPDDVLAVVDGIAAGLTVLHRSGIVHRDVKPGNVLLRTAVHADRTTGPLAGKRVMLGDLGIAKDLQWASGLTVPAGSPAFMAPEQKDLLGRITPAADVHAFAMTVARLLGIEPPWPPSALGAALARATAFEVADRTATAAELAAELRGGLAPWRRANGPVPDAAGAVAPTVPIPVLRDEPRPPAAPQPAVPQPAVPQPAAMPQTPWPPAPQPTPQPAPQPAPRQAPQAAATPQTPWPATEPAGPALSVPSPAQPARRRRTGRSAALAGGVVVLLAVAGFVARPHLFPARLAPADGSGVSLAVPRGWDAGGAADVAFPGSTDDTTGRQVTKGVRSVTIAASDETLTADAVLAVRGVEGCSRPTRRTVTVGTEGTDTYWQGVTHHWVCPNGTADQIVLTDVGESRLVVWVEVRAVAGDPDVETVLGSLEVS